VYRDGAPVALGQGRWAVVSDARPGDVRRERATLDARAPTLDAAHPTCAYDGTEYGRARYGDGIARYDDGRPRISWARTALARERMTTLPACAASATAPTKDEIRARLARDRAAIETLVRTSEKGKA
jgi:hypothetical protein